MTVLRIRRPAAQCLNLYIAVPASQRYPRYFCSHNSEAHFFCLCLCVYRQPRSRRSYAFVQSIYNLRPAIPARNSSATQRILPILVRILGTCCGFYCTAAERCCCCHTNAPPHTDDDKRHRKQGPGGVFCVCGFVWNRSCAATEPSRVDARLVLFLRSVCVCKVSVDDGRKIARFRRCTSV